MDCNFTLFILFEFKFTSMDSWKPECMRVVELDPKKNN